MESPSHRARLSLEGLSVGDAFGECFFVPPDEALARIAERAFPEAPWRFTDDTEMAISVFETLVLEGRVDPDKLAARFARRYVRDPRRGYGATAHDILAAIARGESWHSVSASVFDGGGSMGNGAAMRIAPLGAYFAGDPARVREQATLASLPTHFHPEGQAGAIAVALAAAHVAAGGKGGAELLGVVSSQTPLGETRNGLLAAQELGFEVPPEVAAKRLGSGARVISSDTVPFSLWCVARTLDTSFEEAMWTTVAGLGDRDTTCAIVGGVVALRCPIPRAWIEAREPLPTLPR